MSIASSLLLPAKHAASVMLHAYADWRVGATEAEKHCYKTTKSVLLTFDDYGDARQVGALLDVLGNKNARAMFFLQGDFVEAHPELARHISDAGHIIGNHTYSHQILRGAPESVIRDQITRAPKGPWFRPPQGRYDKTVRRIAAGLGYVICYWTIDSRDWTGAGVTEMRHTILTELHPGAVILFHIHGKHTIELLPGLIDAIRERGLDVTGFDEPDWAPSV